jgi:DNA helicase HerA-like ATPase
MVEFDPADTEMARIVIEELVEAELEAIVMADPFRATNPALPDYLPGNIGIGTVISSEVPYLITAESLLTHMLVCGRTGGGKSNLILLILTQLLVMRQND